MTLGWIVESADSIARYIEFGKRFESPDHASIGLEGSVLGRWLYHPVALINNGLGLSLTIVAVTAYVLAWTHRNAVQVDRASAGALPSVWGVRHAAVHILSTYAVLAIRQPVLESTFSITWAPAVCICVAIYTSRASAVGRRVLLALSVTAIVINLALCSRGPTSDRPGFRFGPIDVVPQCDHYLVAKTADLLVDLPQRGVPWPHREFTSALARAANGKTVTVLTTHQFLCGENLMVDARHLGARGKVIGVNPDQDLPAQLIKCDFFVFDEVLGPWKTASDVMASVGLKVDIVSSATLRPNRSLYLLHRRRP